MSDERFFRGWAKPGPRPSAAPAGGPVKDIDQGETLDAISGYFRLYQLKDGHRFSTDDLLAAWYGTTWCPCARKVLDLGSGIGSVGMIAAWRLQGARFVTVEAQEASIRLARKSARYNGIDDRYEIRSGDFRDPAMLRGPDGSGENELFDLILGSPPYFPLEAGVHGDHPQKVACRFEVRGTIADYCSTASVHLELGGVFACVFPIQPSMQLTRVRDAARDSALSIVRWRPIVLKEGEEPLLGVFLMMRADHLPPDFRTQTWREPPLIIRRADGRVHPEYMSVKLAIGFPP